MEGQHKNSKYCSQGCRLEGLRRQNRKSRGCVERVDFIECPVCHRQMASLTKQHIAFHGFSSTSAFMEHFGLSTVQSSSLLQHSREQAKQGRKLSPTGQGGHSLASIEKMRQNRKGKGIGICGKYERTPEIRARISRGVIKTWHTSHNYQGSWVETDKGFGGRVWARSSWEKRVLAVFDAHPSIESFRVEPFRIPYTFDGVERTYIPDFLVVSSSGSKEVWEIKPRYFLSLPKNQAKIDALNAFCVANDYNARIVLLKDIEEMERQVREK